MTRTYFDLNSPYSAKVGHLTREKTYYIPQETAALIENDEKNPHCIKLGHIYICIENILGHVTCCFCKATTSFTDMIYLCIKMNIHDHFNRYAHCCILI